MGSDGIRKKENSLKVLLFGERIEDKSLKGLQKEFRQRGTIDIVFLVLVMYFVVFGTIMMFSASYPRAEIESPVMDFAKGEYGPYGYLIRQLGFLALGIPVMLVASMVKTEFVKRYSTLFFGISVILLVVVLFFHSNVQSADGDEYKRWIDLGPITLQPSDIAKLALIAFLATLLDTNRKRVETDWKALLPLSGVVIFIAALVVLEKHFSATFLILLIGFAMMYLGGGKRWCFILVIAAAIVGIVILVVNMDVFPGYVQERLKGWLDRDYDPTGSRWQTNQSLYAIGSGGLFGVGLGNSKQKHLYLPEPHNDFIFSVICEELGYIRAVLFVIVPFALLVLRGFQIAMRTKNRYASLLVMGIMVQVGIQTFFNIGVVTGMLPNTGISLPFFSFGGTALVMLLGEMGLVLSVSRRASINE